jgi:hypothetical protein
MRKNLKHSFKAYLAGFLDGDGSIYVRAKPNSSYKYDYQVAPTIAFFQSGTNAKFPELCKHIQFGKLRLRKDDIFEYTITKQAEIQVLLEELMPYLVLKQEQARLMLKILRVKQDVSSREDFKKLLALIEQFRELNYSKKRKVRTLTP